MDRKTIYWQDLDATVQLCGFVPRQGVPEYHAMLHVLPQGEDFSHQLDRLYQATARMMQQDGLQGAVCVLKRYFLSDAANQQPLMRLEPSCAVSVIQQPPLDGSKVALWMYMLQGADVHDEGGMTVVEHNGYRHLWKMGMHEHKGDSAWQTESLLIGYEEQLQRYGATIAEHCLRTWFFVRDVDTQYAGMVKARRENFAEQGLTAQTHFISSTGIGGVPADTRALVQLGCYALTGFAPGQQRYLYAPTHLNPTYEYGVTFERGTVMDYGDRRHVLISGTASIDNRGEVVHVGDVVKQTQRMWENVEALLAEADATYQDVAHFIVYLRDMADYAVVQQLFAGRFPDVPTVFTLAPVCRPAWLIEMECMAVKPLSGNAYRPF